MEYVVSILALAAVITVWGYFFSKWTRARGGCGSCGAMGTDPGNAASCRPDQPECPRGDIDPGVESEE